MTDAERARLIAQPLLDLDGVTTDEIIALIERHFAEVRRDEHERTLARLSASVVLPNRSVPSEWEEVQAWS